MSYYQLTQTNRIEIAILFRTGMSYRAIAKHIGCHHSTVSRELQRHPWHNPSGYDARQARLQLARKRLHANQHHRKLPLIASLVALVETKLRINWSPEQIAGWMKDTGKRLRVCAQTIYDWLYRFRHDLLKHLHCRKGKYRRTRANTLRKAFRDKQKEPRRITARPAHVMNRKRYGHWEGDTVVGKGRSGYIATFVERKSGYLLACKLERNTAAAFERAATVCLSQVISRYRQTLTLDNGTEMANFEEIERRTGTRLYFAHPYHSWERGTNENTNGLLRFYFPKQMNFTHLTQGELDQAVKQLNTRPRKRLGYKTPEQVLRRSGAVRARV
ncbi:MAG: IS30 family transposase [Candidatus Binatia bacterium]